MDRQSFTVRPADYTDLSQLAAIEQASPGAAVWGADGYRTALVGDAGRSLLVAEASGAVVALLLYAGLPGEEAEVLNLAVDPAFRRRGIAKALVERLIAGGHARILLEVRASNDSAQHFYAGLGFRQIATRKKYYRAPLEDAYVLERTRPSAAMNRP